MKTLEELFDPASRERIAQAVRDAERRTVGQIVPVVVESSAVRETGVERLGWLGLFASTALMLGLGRPEAVGSFALIQAATVTLFSAAAFIPAVQRRLRKAATWERALRAFHEHGLAGTEGRTGVLIFASIFERRVVILGDDGIHARMGSEGWNEAVRVFVDRIRAGAPADGFCEAIALVGQRLAEHFPRLGPGPGDELPDELNLDR